MRTLALIALSLVLLHAAADVLPDGPLFWLVTPLRAVVVVGLLALIPTIRRPERPALVRRLPFDIAVVLLLVAAAVPAHAYDGWPQWRGLLTCAAVAYLAMGVVRSSPESWRAITLVALAGVATAALTGIRQTVNGIPTGFCRGALDGSADACGNEGVMFRALGTFGNPNLLAGFLILLIPLAAAYAAGHTARQTRVAGYLVVTAGVGGVLASGSRAALLALAGSLVAYLVLRHPTTPRLLAAGAGIAGTLLAGAIVLLTGGGAGVRADVWRAAASIVRDHPFGVGMGRTGPFLQQAIPGTEQFRHAHNMWLDTLLEAGPVGLLAMIVLTVVAAVSVVRAARQGSAAGVALGAALAGFAVFCLFDDPLNAVRNAYVAWAVLGLTVAVGQTAHHHELVRPRPPIPRVHGALASGGSVGRRHAEDREPQRRHTPRTEPV